MTQAHLLVTQVTNAILRMVSSRTLVKLVVLEVVLKLKVLVRSLGIF